jgi:FHS family L-fucose permease-like MFS transporter
VIACGLATLETAANSYAVVIGDPASASARLQFCQSWNGVASFIGPLIASKFFFTGKNAHNLVNVQFVYLAVACAGVAIAILFLVAKLPEVSEEMLNSSTAVENFAIDEFGNEIGQGPLYKQYNMIFGFIAQFCYVGAQVTVASFFINYATENAAFSSAKASNLLSYALITFTISRFIATFFATLFEADFLLMVYAVCTIVFNAVIIASHGKGAVVTLILLFFFEAPMYPTLFTLGTANLGRHTRRGAGILVMGVSGGAVFPPIQGAIADSAGTRISYIVPLVGFAYVLGYTTFHWIRHGRHIIRVKDIVVAASTIGATGMVIETIHYDGDKAFKVEEAELSTSS